MDAAPAVTVIMPVRNGAMFIRQALDSVCAQTFTSFVLLVVDDASTDGTRELVSAYVDPRVRLLELPQPLGPAAARNRGLAQARSRYVAFADSDDIADQHRLQVQVECLSRHPDVGLVASRVNVVDAAGRPAGDDWGWDGPPELLAPSMLFRNGVATSTVTLDRSALGAERFDETLAVASDYDLWVRVLARRTGLVLPERLAQYRVHPSNLTHRRRANAEACLDRIARRQLVRLGIDPSDADVAMHRRLANRLVNDRRALVAAERWLRRLEMANLTTQVYAPDAFGRVVQGELAAARDSTASAGSWAVWRRRLKGLPRKFLAHTVASATRH